ncbi:hypothetical protein R80B4_02449 [Fibrobacteres bacterium R8-0-B4]
MSDIERRRELAGQLEAVCNDIRVMEEVRAPLTDQPF